MKGLSASAFLALLATAVVFAAPAGAARGDQLCETPSGANGATSCTLILDLTITGPLESDVVTGCVGEDVFLDLHVHVIGHQVFRPDGSLDTKAGATVHGSGYGLVTGTPIIFNENAEAFVDHLPTGGLMIHTVSTAEVNTAGSAPNLEFTIESQFEIAPDGTLAHDQSNAQAKCGAVHEHEHA